MHVPNNLPTTSLSSRIGSKSSLRQRVYLLCPARLWNLNIMAGWCTSSVSWKFDLQESRRPGVCLRVGVQIRLSELLSFCCLRGHASHTVSSAIVSWVSIHQILNWGMHVKCIQKTNRNAYQRDFKLVMTYLRSSDELRNDVDSRSWHKTVSEFIHNWN